MSYKRKRIYNTAIYLRLSREDGDKSESDSIFNQRKLTGSYVNNSDSLLLVEEYSDDGYSGTNFERPAFKRMIKDIEAGRIDCVVVKDLSRFGREYIGMGYYLEQMFVECEVRFIAILDSVDSLDGEYDIIVPIKNLFNTQYAIDISKKTQSSFKVKQRSGEFVGAFPSYGYRKSDADRHTLVIDDYAASVVRRIFDMYLQGMGKIAIAKRLNEEGILCPSAYKRVSGFNYRNCNRLDTTSYWTYSSICRILENQMYIGNMVQGKTKRRMKGRARPVDKDDWIIVSCTHEPIISMDTWNRTQTLLSKEIKSPNFDQNVSPFAGFLKCGDCGRAMCKKRSRTSAGEDSPTHGLAFTCGSYTRYGSKVCSAHYISYDVLESIILSDLALIISEIDDLAAMIKDELPKDQTEEYHKAESARIKAELARIEGKKLALYDDYREELISKKEYLTLREQYIEREELLGRKLAEIEAARSQKPSGITDIPWVRQLLKTRSIAHLDRQIIVDMIDRIDVYEDKRIRIIYNFTDELQSLLENAPKTA